MRSFVLYMVYLFSSFTSTADDVFAVVPDKKNATRPMMRVTRAGNCYVVNRRDTPTMKRPVKREAATARGSDKRVCMVAETYQVHPNINVLSGNLQHSSACAPGPPRMLRMGADALHGEGAGGVVRWRTASAQKRPKPLPGDSFLRYVTEQ